MLRSMSKKAQFGVNITFILLNNGAGATKITES